MITQSYLKNLLNYDQRTGLFTWLVSRGCVKCGTTAGRPTGGYVEIRIDKQAYPAHALAWLYMTGTLPNKQVDHKDLVRSNNAWDNLRLATASENQCNRGKQSNNTTGWKGLVFDTSTNKWYGRVKKQGNNFYTDYCVDKEVAVTLLKTLRRLLHGDFTNDGEIT